ncbi:MAG: tRNA threonylcarbamoyladenosine biosynthesis protein [Bacteroidetes bacterium]|nr:MAG: tRNA threonylcarbamoyladenosine biosynthesis protein [Bacteroidota bacterium]
MLIRINSDNPQDEPVRRVADCLRSGGIVIYPTDTVYGMGCDINQPKALERLCRLKGISPDKANFSIICHDLSHLADFTKPIPNPVFRVLKRALPGPYTFILDASNDVPKLFQGKKRTVGIRVPDNDIVRAIVKELGHPIASTSVHDDDDELMEYYSDPEMIYEKYKDKVDLVINGGFGNLQASTVIDCTGGDFVIVREGLGDTSIIL